MNPIMIGCAAVLAVACGLVAVLLAALVAGSRADDDLLGDRQYIEDDDGYPPVGV